MEQRQTVGTKDGMVPPKVPSVNDLFVFRPVVAAPTLPHAQSSSLKRVADKSVADNPGTDNPSLLEFRFSSPPARAGRPKSQDPLLEPDAAYFRQLLTQYWTFPTNEEDPTACVHFNLQAISIIYGLIAKSESQVLTYADLHQLEMALVHVMPEAVLRSEAGLLRARYRAVAPPALFRQYVRSKLTPEDDAAGPVEALRAEMTTLLSETQHYWACGDRRTGAHTARKVSVCWTLGSCVLGALGFALLHFFSVPPQIAPAIPLLMALLGGAAAAFVYIRREHS